MSNTCFKFKQFLINQDRCAMKVTTDACLFGAWVAERLRNAEGNCLDIGTGTGLLSLMLAQKAAGIFTVAVEIDADCAEQARENIEASPWKQQVVVKEADILQYTPANQYDFIISNPPFYQDDLKSPDTRKNVAHHDHGLQFTDLIATIGKWLKPGGRFFILLPYKRNDSIAPLLTKKGLSILERVPVRPTTKHGYFRVMIEGNKADFSPQEEKITEVVIKDSNDQYTDTFTQLLKDYYLHL